MKPFTQLISSHADQGEHTISNGYQPSIIRIFRNAIPVGVGFLASQRHIVTCAHVVADALDIPTQTLEIPTGHVSLDLPFVARGVTLTAQVIYWLPPQSDGSGDIAVLTLNTALPEDAHAGHLVMVDNLWKHSWHAFGFPSGYDDGLWSFGTVLENVTDTLLQIDGLSEQGFSGSPVWSEQAAGIVGMVDSVGRNSNRGFMIPLSTLVKFCPELEQYVVQGEKPKRD